MTCIVCKGASHGMKTCGDGSCQHVHLHAVMADGCACDACVGIGTTRMAAIKEASKARTIQANRWRLVHDKGSA